MAAFAKFNRTEMYKNPPKAIAVLPPRVPTLNYTDKSFMTQKNPNMEIMSSEAMMLAAFYICDKQAMLVIGDENSAKEPIPYVLAKDGKLVTLDKLKENPNAGIFIELFESMMDHTAIIAQMARNGKFAYKNLSGYFASQGLDFFPSEDAFSAAKWAGGVMGTLTTEEKAAITKKMSEDKFFKYRYTPSATPGAMKKFHDDMPQVFMAIATDEDSQIMEETYGKPVDLPILDGISDKIKAATYAYYVAAGNEIAGWVQGRKSYEGVSGTKRRGLVAILKKWMDLSVNTAAIDAAKTKEGLLEALKEMMR